MFEEDFDFPEFRFSQTIFYSNLILDDIPKATVHPANPFDATRDGHALRTAMKGFSTDEQSIIDILTARTNEQRQQIKKIFLHEYGHDLIEDLQNELGGKFEKIIMALMSPPVEYLCKQLHKAMSGIRTNEEALVEILCEKSNEEIAQIVACYEDMFGRPLVEQICSETSGHFQRLLTLIVTGVRDPVNNVDADKAKIDAELLYNAGESKLGTDEEIFNRIMAHSSFAQLRLVFEEYKALSGMAFEEAIKHEMSEELQAAMVAIECVQFPPAFFAKCLFNAMEGADLDNNTLIRIIISRSEIDLGNIKEEFGRIYNRTLLSAVQSETSGHYKRALCALIDDT